MAKGLRTLPGIKVGQFSGLDLPNSQKPHL